MVVRVLVVVEALATLASRQHRHRCLGMVVKLLYSNRVSQVSYSVQLPILVGLWVMLKALVRIG